MTNHPRYSPPPPPGRRPEPAAAGYPGAQRPDPYQQQPYDWRYQTQQQQPFRAPYDPYSGAPQPGTARFPHPPLPVQQAQKRSRAGSLIAGAIAVAVVSAGVGGGVALLAQSERPAATSTINGAAPGQPVASLPAGTVEQVAAKVVPSVVKLEVDLGRQSEEGSGIILSQDGLILTNNHVVSAAARDRPGGPGGPAAPTGGGGAQTKVTFADGRSAPFTVLGTDPSSDIAVVRAQGVTGLTPITVGSSANLRVGQDVVAIGSPLGLEGTVTTGIISALNRPVAAGGDIRNQNTVLDAVQTDAAINPGNSGGPLVNLKGEVIGVNTRASFMANNIGFAIPGDVVKEIVAALLKHRRVPRAWLGLKLQHLDSVENTMLASGKDGVLVAAIATGSPAQEAQLRPGDVITQLNGKPFAARFEEQIPSLYRRIANLSLKADATLRLVRRGRSVELKIRPASLGKQVGKEHEIKAWGITVRAITKRMQRDMQLADTMGVVVTGARAGSAASGRLDSPDIIRTVQGKKITDLASFLRLVAASVERKDKLVRLTLRRSTVSDVTALKPSYRSSSDKAKKGDR